MCECRCMTRCECARIAQHVVVGQVCVCVNVVAWLAVSVHAPHKRRSSRCRNMLLQVRGDCSFCSHLTQLCVHHSKILRWTGGDAGGGCACLMREVQRHMRVLNCHGGCVVQLVMDWWCRWWSDGDNTAAVRYATTSTRSACARVTLCAEALKRRNRWRSERTRSNVDSWSRVRDWVFTSVHCRRLQRARNFFFIPPLVATRVGALR
jgi:hypothetical protein